MVNVHCRHEKEGHETSLYHILNTGIKCRKWTRNTSLSPLVNRIRKREKRKKKERWEQNGCSCSEENSSLSNCAPLFLFIPSFVLSFPSLVPLIPVLVLFRCSPPCSLICSTSAPYNHTCMYNGEWMYQEKKDQEREREGLHGKDKGRENGKRLKEREERENGKDHQSSKHGHSFCLVQI